MPLTLNETLRDDVVALETSVFRLLPGLDASGRQLLFCDPCQTRDGCTSESMVRSVMQDMRGCTFCGFVMNVGFHIVDFFIL